MPPIPLVAGRGVVVVGEAGGVTARSRLSVYLSVCPSRCAASGGLIASEDVVVVLLLRQCRASQHRVRLRLCSRPTHTSRAGIRLARLLEPLG